MMEKIAQLREVGEAGMVLVVKQVLLKIKKQTMVNEGWRLRVTLMQVVVKSF